MKSCSGLMSQGWLLFRRGCSSDLCVGRICSHDHSHVPGTFWLDLGGPHRPAPQPSAADPRACTGGSRAAQPLEPEAAYRRGRGFSPPQRPAQGPHMRLRGRRPGDVPVLLQETKPPGAWTPAPCPVPIAHWLTRCLCLLPGGVTVASPPGCEAQGHGQAWCAQPVLAEPPHTGPC